jgi:2-dehydro-3-deoxygluconokinase
MPALSESTRRLALDVLDRSKNLNKTISFDVNFRPALWSEARASLIVREMAAKADIVFGDRKELELLVDKPETDNHELLQQVASLGPSQVMMKLADEGAVALIDGGYFEQAAVKVDVVDTVGAGDAFVAGYLSALLDHEKEKERLFRAAFCGAMACTSSGDWEGAAFRVDLASARRELV